MSERLIPTVVVLDRICMSKTQMYRLIAAGEFPKPVPIGRHRVAFLETEVAAWIDENHPDLPAANEQFKGYVEELKALKEAMDAVAGPGAAPARP